MLKHSFSAFLKQTLAAGFGLTLLGLCSGCGDGERMESGTQVEVSQDMLDEAEASDAYFDSEGQGAPQ